MLVGWRPISGDVGLLILAAAVELLPRRGSDLTLPFIYLSIYLFVCLFVFVLPGPDRLPAGGAERPGEPEEGPGEADQDVGVRPEAGEVGVCPPPPPPLGPNTGVQKTPSPEPEPNGPLSCGGGVGSACWAP